MKGQEMDLDELKAQARKAVADARATRARMDRLIGAETATVPSEEREARPVFSRIGTAPKETRNEVWKILRLAGRRNGPGHDWNTTINVGGGSYRFGWNSRARKLEELT